MSVGNAKITPQINVAIDRLVIRDPTVDSAIDADRSRLLVGEALALLAERLHAERFADGTGADLVLDAIEVRDLAPGALFAPGGARRLADALYRQLTRRLA